MKDTLAACQLNNFGGIAVLEVIYGLDDKVKFAYYDAGVLGRICTAKIRYDEEGLPYFISARQKYYLSEFITISYNQPQQCKNPVEKFAI